MNPSPKIFWLKYSKLLKCYMMQPLTSDQQLWKGSYASMLLILCMPSKPPMTYTLPPNTAILCLQRPMLRYSICIHLLMEALYFQTSCFVSLPPVVYMACKYDSTACIYFKTPICLKLCSLKMESKSLLLIVYWSCYNRRKCLHLVYLIVKETEQFLQPNIQWR